jgi:hypothetical protein
MLVVPKFTFGVLRPPTLRMKLLTTPPAPRVLLSRPAGVHGRN